MWSVVIGALLSLSAIVLSIWPGRLELVGITLFYGLCALTWVWVPLTVVGYWLWRNSRKIALRGQGSSRSGTPYRGRTWILASVLMLSWVLVANEIPLRLAFALSAPAFDVLLLEDEPGASERGRVGQHDLRRARRVGVYSVDTIAVGELGGVFFRTTKYEDGPDVLSYGFAYQPEPDGTPFGNAHYELIRLRGDWHVFFVSSDF